MADSRPAPDHVVLEGFHPLKHALRFGGVVRSVFAADPDHVEGLAARLAPDLLAVVRRLPLEVVAPEELARLAGGRSHGNPDVVAYAERPTIDVDRVLEHALAPVVVLEDPTHLGNIGAVIRVAAAASAAAVLTTGALDPWHSAAVRGSAGLHYALAVARVKLEDVLARDRALIAADPDGDAEPGPLPRRATLVLGSERRGLTDRVLELADVRVCIPMREGVSSLNLATAAAVLLYAGGPRHG
ncbi:MAG TPA: TrmH family RNA methyltransferase [Longimicrobiales bacterium]